MVNNSVVQAEKEEVKVVYEGETYGIVYVKTELPYHGIFDIYDTLPHLLGRALDYVQKHLGDVVAILPNVKFSFPREERRGVGYVLSPCTRSDLQLYYGVVGVAIIYRRRLGQKQDQKA